MAVKIRPTAHLPSTLWQLFKLMLKLTDLQVQFVWSTTFFHINLLLLRVHKPSLGWFTSSSVLCVYHKLLHQPLAAITSVCSSHHLARPSVGWISVNKDVFYEFHWLFELQSRSSHKHRIEDMKVYRNESANRGRYKNAKKLFEPNYWLADSTEIRYSNGFT